MPINLCPFLHCAGYCWWVSSTPFVPLESRTIIFGAGDDAVEPGAAADNRVRVRGRVFALGGPWEGYVLTNHVSYKLLAQTTRIERVQREADTMESSSYRLEAERQKQLELRKKIKRLQSQLTDIPDDDPRLQSPKRKKPDATLLAPATPSPSEHDRSSRGWPLTVSRSQGRKGGSHRLPARDVNHML